MADHRLLLEIFGAIAGASRAGDFPVVQQCLEHFRVVLQDHLLKENVRLYVYLGHLLARDAAGHEVIHGFRREMDAIGKVVVGFLTKYKAIGTQPELAPTFADDLDAIGNALTTRIQREEDALYPMYVPPA